MSEYQEFLKSKVVHDPPTGFDPGPLNDMLYPFQRDIVQWALRRGRAAIFADCGLGKTPMQLEWARHVAEHTGLPVLILAPLAVAGQTKDEGVKFGIEVNIAKNKDDVLPGINITNYERLHLFDPTVFGGVVLDESSILKNFMGKTKQAIIEAFRQTEYKLACTATPAPNDHMELGNHSDFLNVMPANEMLSRWFINDTMNFGTYRLKGHAIKSYWEWVASWAVCISKPSDMGYPDDKFSLPPLNIQELILPVDHTKGTDEKLFRLPALNATELHKEMRLTAASRAARVAELVNGDSEYWIVWCNTDYEADELKHLIPDGVEVRGSMNDDLKESHLRSFGRGEFRVIITKPSIAGLGLNWQHCHNVAFVGLSYSYEQLYQALRRSWRFGQDHEVNAYIILAETEQVVLDSVKRKQKEHENMQSNMYQYNFSKTAMVSHKLTDNCPRKVESGYGWMAINSDSAEYLKEVEPDTVDFTVTSIPFSNLYIYSDSIRDMGNCKNDQEFFDQFSFLVPEICRVTKPGRLAAIHCKDLVNYKNRDGMAGLRDFPGEIIRAFQAGGWAYHSRVTIWKCPVTEMTRTKAQGLLYKQLRKDSSFSRQGLADYLLIFRKAGDNPAPVTHTKKDFPLPDWQEYASPVWMDIRQMDVLNVQQARESEDEKHICPLQLDLIERCLRLWTNPGDLVLDPFSGIGSVGYVAVKTGRKYLGIELKESYWKDSIRHLKRAEIEGENTPLLTMIDDQAGADQ